MAQVFDALWAVADQEGAGLGEAAHRVMVRARAGSCGSCACASRASTRGVGVRPALDDPVRHLPQPGVAVLGDLLQPLEGDGRGPSVTLDEDADCLADRLVAVDGPPEVLLAVREGRSRDDPVARQHERTEEQVPGDPLVRVDPARGREDDADTVPVVGIWTVAEDEVADGRVGGAQPGMRGRSFSLASPARSLWPLAVKTRRSPATTTRTVTSPPKSSDTRSRRSPARR